MASRPVLLALLLLLAPAAAHAQGWRSVEHAAELRALPAGWAIESSSSQSLRLTKRIERDGVEMLQRITVTVARDTYGSVEAAVRDLEREGFAVVDRARLAVDSLGAPFWFLNRYADDVETAWCALLLRAGRVFLLDLRAAREDPDAISDFARLVESFRLLPDPRQAAWAALGASDGAAAERGFHALLAAERSDADARYGLGLSYLAQGRPDDAIRELELARPALGIIEDVRRALGRAELARGRTARGLALLVRVLRDDRRWDPELRPFILAAVGTLHGERFVRTSVPNWALSGIATEFLSRASSGNTLVLQALLTQFRTEFERALDECASSGCGANAAAEVVFALDVEHGMALCLSAHQSGDYAALQESYAALAEPFKALSLLTR